MTEDRDRLEKKVEELQAKMDDLLAIILTSEKEEMK